MRPLRNLQTLSAFFQSLENTEQNKTVLWYNIIKRVDRMSPELQARRLEAVKRANAVNKIEGASVSTQAKTLSAKWAWDEISGAAMKATLIAKHKQG